MHKLAFLIAALLALACAEAASAQALPHFAKNGEATQLIVNDAPFLMMAGEVHNSASSSPAFMAPIWDQLARNHVKTVIGSASWELVEPEEGNFDFSAVDEQIHQARAHGLRLVLIWFGAYKNAESTYAPSWVRHDEGRFPRGQRNPAAKLPGLAAYFGPNPILNVFSEQVVRADANAFATLMRHIRQVDRRQTVIMIQVENEVGLRGDSRDRSALGLAAWSQPVPPELIKYLHKHRDHLDPELAEVWKSHGFREAGTWADMFGTDSRADEIFMAWAFGRYVEQVAKAGAAEYPLPMYTNAWLGPVPGSETPGDYPSGGPVARMMDVWKAAAPTLALLAPDVYIDDFNRAVSNFRRADNPIFIPEAHLDAGNLFLALGQHSAIGFSPFGIEDGADNHDIFAAYRLIDTMSANIATAQASGRIRGFRVSEGSTQSVSLNGYDLTISGPIATTGAFGAGTGSVKHAAVTGYGLIIQTDDGAFLIAARGVVIRFAAPDARVEIDSAVEGTFRDGRWTPGRTLNGDERLHLVPEDRLGLVQVRLLRR